MFPLLLTFACDSGFEDPSRESAPAPGSPSHAVTVHRPTTLGVVDTPETDVHGTPIGVACSTCHAGAEPWAAAPGEPEQFHTGVDLQHGSVTCASCHSPERPDLLRLADGSTLDIMDAHLLCAQCHGPQYRDYQHGAHGGMSGHWDLSVGPRERNNCVDCHAPHAPAIEPVLPAHPPKDRFLPAPSSAQEH